MIFSSLSPLHSQASNQIENPYEYAGYLHNKGLNYLIREFPYPITDMKRLYDLSTKFIQTELNIYEGNFMSYSDFKYLLDLITNTTDYNTILQKFIDEEWIFPRLVPYAQAIIDILYSTEDSLKMQQNFYSFENIISSSSLSECEKRIFLSGCSIGRNSLIYWQSQFNNPTSPWKTSNINSNTLGSENSTRPDILSPFDSNSRNTNNLLSLSASSSRTNTKPIDPNPLPRGASSWRKVFTIGHIFSAGVDTLMFYMVSGIVVNKQDASANDTFHIVSSIASSYWVNSKTGH